MCSNIRESHGQTVVKITVGQLVNANDIDNNNYNDMEYGR